MTNHELYKMINLPSGVIAQLDEYEEHRKGDIPMEIRSKNFERATWDEGVKDLKAFLGNDSYNINTLWEQLNFVCNYSYPEYRAKGISDEVFTATFGFITRFVGNTKNNEGKYKYDKDWWFPRQITLQEFRIGSLEYEFVNFNGIQEVEVHIPSDANMTIEALKQSFNDFFIFRDKFFPGWNNKPITTETWMIMPELEEFLAADSRILGFKQFFQIDNVDYDQTWYMEWLFPGHTKIDENLPERTTLQRKLKKYLMQGNKFGVAKGHLILERL